MARRRSTEVWIAGERWRLVEAKLRSSYGVCDYQTRTIKVCSGLPAHELLDTLLHELIHARWPDIAEESVVEFAAILAAAVTDWGFRRVEDA